MIRLMDYLKQYQKWKFITLIGSFSCLVVSSYAFAERPVEAQDNIQRMVKINKIHKSGASKMSMLNIEIDLRKDRTLFGESMPVTVTLTNTGQPTLSVHSPDSPSEFEFILRPKDPNKQVIVLTELSALLARDNNPPPSMPFEMVTLSSGTKAIYQDDLAGYQIDPIETGEYQLSVAYAGNGERIESKTVNLGVVPANISHLTAVNDNDSLFVTFSHHDSKNIGQVFRHESRSENPNDGVAFQRAKTTSLVSGVASAQAVSEDEELDGGWFAWLDGDALGAGADQFNTLFMTIDPIPLTLQSAVLQPAGWRTGVNDAQFAVVGLNQKGEISFASVNFSALNKTGTVHTAPLLLAKLPEHWVAGLRSGSTGNDQYDFISSLESGTELKIVHQVLMPRSGKAGSEVVLYKSEKKLSTLALSLPVVINEQSNMLDVLLGSLSDPSQITFLRIPLDGGEPELTYTFTIKVDLHGNQPEQWAISPAGYPEPIVVVKFGNRILAKKFGANSQNFILSEQAEHVHHLQLTQVGEAIWLLWSDDSDGVHYKKLP